MQIKIFMSQERKKSRVEGSQDKKDKKSKRERGKKEGRRKEKKEGRGERRHRNMMTLLQLY